MTFLWLIMDCYSGTIAFSLKQVVIFGLWKYINNGKELKSDRYIIY